MRNLLFIVAVILIIGWVIGYFGYNVGGAFHLLLVLAFVAILYNLISGKKAL